MRSKEPVDFAVKVEQISKLCMKNYNIELLHKSRLSGLNQLIELVQNVEITDITSEITQIMTESNLHLIEHFFSNIQRYECIKSIPKMKIDKVEKACDIFRVMNEKFNEFSSDILNTLIAYLEKRNLFCEEFICGKLWDCFVLNEERYGKMLETAINILNGDFLENMEHRRVLIRNLYNVLIEKDLKNFSQDTITNYLDLLYKSVINPDPKYSPLHTGLKRGLLIMTKKLQNENLITIINSVTETILNFTGKESMYDLGHILLLATEYLNVASFSDLHVDTFSKMLDLLKDQTIENCSLGHRVLHNIMDRNGNLTSLQRPIIYYLEFNYPFKVPDLIEDDLEFMQDNRVVIHDYILKSVIKHGVRTGVKICFFYFKKIGLIFQLLNRIKDKDFVY